MQQQLELASELESDLRDTEDWGKKWLIDFNAEKTQLILFDRCNNNGSIDVKINRSVPEEKSSFKIFGLTFSSKLYCGSYIDSIAKTASKKIGALIRSKKFLSPEVALYHYKSTITQAWNTVFTSVATWTCQTSYKKEYAGLLVLQLLLLLNPWLIVEM